MAIDDDTLIGEVRALTDYGSDIIDDTEMQALVDLGKQEISARLGDEPLTFYEEETYHASRALFWFVCIAAKVKTGEIAGMNISADDFEATNPAVSHYGFWFDSFQKKLGRAERSWSPGAALVNLSRENRSYGDQ